MTLDQATPSFEPPDDPPPVGCVLCGDEHQRADLDDNGRCKTCQTQSGRLAVFLRAAGHNAEVVDSEDVRVRVPGLPDLLVSRHRGETSIWLEMSDPTKIDTATALLRVRLQSASRTHAITLDMAVTGYSALIEANAGAVWLVGEVVGALRSAQ